MRFVLTEGRALELNYMWLPTWLGQNFEFKRELEASLGPRFVGRPVTEDTLDEANSAVIAFIVQKYPDVPGLGDYLDGIKFVEM